MILGFLIFFSQAVLPSRAYRWLCLIFCDSRFAPDLSRLRGIVCRDCPRCGETIYCSGPPSLWLVTRCGCGRFLLMDTAEVVV